MGEATNVKRGNSGVFKTTHAPGLSIKQLRYITRGSDIQLEMQTEYSHHSPQPHAPPQFLLSFYSRFPLILYKRKILDG